MRIRRSRFYPFNVVLDNPGNEFLFLHYNSWKHQHLSLPICLSLSLSLPLALFLLLSLFPFLLLPLSLILSLPSNFSPILRLSLSLFLSLSTPFPFSCSLSSPTSFSRSIPFPLSICSLSLVSDQSQSRAGSEHHWGLIYVSLVVRFWRKDGGISGTRAWSCSNFPRAFFFFFLHKDFQAFRNCKWS